MMKPETTILGISQFVINAIVLLILIPIILYISTQAEQLHDYDSHMLSALSEMQDACQQFEPDKNIDNNMYTRRIKTIITNLPDKFLVKDLEKTKGIQSLLKIYQLGYMGNICELDSLHLRARGVSSFADVLSILMLKDHQSEILKTLQMKIFQQKYSLKNISSYQEGQFREFVFFIWSHRHQNKKTNNNQTLMDIIGNFQMTVNSINSQQYPKKYKIVYIGDSSTFIQSQTSQIDVAQTYLTQKFNQSNIIFEKVIVNQDKKVSKLKNLQYYIRKHCNQENIATLMNSGDRLVSPYTLLLINQEYLKGAWITTSKEIYRKQLAIISERYTHFYQFSAQEMEKIKLSIQGHSISPVRQYNFNNLKTFSVELFNRLQTSKLILQISTKKDKAGHKIEETSILDLEDSLQNDPDVYDQRFIYPLIEISGRHYHFIPEILYDKNSYQLVKEMLLTDVEKQRINNILYAIKNSAKLSSTEILASG